MSTPAAFHLPGLDAAPLARRRLADTTFEVPDLAPAMAARVWEHLDLAAAEWRRRPLSERVDLLADVAAALGRRGPGSWNEWLVRSTGLSQPGLAAAWHVTFAPHDRASMLDAVRQEFPGAPANFGSARRVVHVLAGNVLPPAFTMLVRGWLVGAPQWLRPAAREPLFAACVLDALRDLAPQLAATCAVLWWPHGCELERAVFENAGVVTVQGDDVTVETLRRRVAQSAPDARCVDYGSRWSLALVSRLAQTPENARRIAWDVALFDQQGCLSPSLVLAEDGAGLGDWCAALAAELARLDARLPRGLVSDVGRASLRAWRESMRLGVALQTVRQLWESPASSAWAVALLDRCRFEESPLDRHVPVVPFTRPDAILPALGARIRQLQGAAVDLDGWDDASRDRLLADLAPTRIAPPGELQLAPAGWPQDHHPPLGCLV